MSENTETRTERTTVRQFRHDARNTLVQARESLSLRTEKTREVYVLLNGTIESIIRGVSGLSQDQQVERLNEARDVVAGNKESLEEAVSAAIAEVEALVEGWKTSFAEALEKADAILEEGATFARERDFEAHQATKGRRGGWGGYASGGTVSAESADLDDEEDEEDD